MTYAAHMLNSEMVKRLRNEAGLSAAQLGAAAGVTGRHVRRYEAGQSEPSLSVAGLMAQALGVSVESLITHEPEADTPATARGKTTGDGTAAAKRSPAPVQSGG